jgi:hypothetical protein
LIDIAYLLRPEVQQITKEIIENFDVEIQKRTDGNSEYYEGVCTSIGDRIGKLRSLSAEMEARWRRIKHQEV